MALPVGCPWALLVVSMALPMAPPHVCPLLGIRFSICCEDGVQMRRMTREEAFANLIVPMDWEGNVVRRVERRVHRRPLPPIATGLRELLAWHVYYIL